MEIAMTNSLKIELMSRLGTFRPSDRTHIDNALKDGVNRQTALDAIKDFVIGWEEADWLEAYSIERIGKWIAKYQSKDTVDVLSGWARKNSPSARQPARPALLRGLEVGVKNKEFA